MSQNTPAPNPPDPSGGRETANQVPVKAAAPAPAPPPAKPSPSDDKTIQKQEDALNDLFMGTLREIREEVQNILLSLATIRKAGTNPKIDEREKLFPVAWDENREIIASNLDPVNALFQKFQNEIYSKEPGGPGMYDFYGDEVTRIANKWERFSKFWDKYGKSRDELLGRADELEEILCEIIFRINTLTIPDRINEHFKTMYPGQELDFEETFGDELSSKDDALRILQNIESHPQCIHGVVDPAKGRIYKVDPRPWRVVMSFVILGFLGAIGLLIAFFLPEFLNAANYPLSIAIPRTLVAGIPVTTIDITALSPADLRMVRYLFCTCYVLIIMGGFAHLLISGVKQARSAKEGSFLAVEGWIRWFHIKEQKNWAAVIFLFIGFAGMIFILKTADYAAAFFVGYSIDSFVDLFLARFDVVVTTGTTELKKKVPRESAEPAT